MEQIAGLEITVLDDVVAFAVLMAVQSGNSLDFVVSRVERRHRNVEAVRTPLACPREGEARSRRRRGPSRRKLQRELATAAIHIADQLDADVDGPGRRGKGNDRHPRRDVHRNSGNDHQLAQLLSVRKVRLAPPHRRSDRDRHTGHEVSRLRRQHRLGGGPIQL